MFVEASMSFVIYQGVKHYGGLVENGDLIDRLK